MRKRRRHDESKKRNRILDIIIFLGSTYHWFIPHPGIRCDYNVGEVNDTNQIISDGEIYEVDDTPQGDDLVKNYIGRKVRVTGKLRIEGDMRILEVTAFEAVKE